jgi:hypothetical protein
MLALLSLLPSKHSWNDVAKVRSRLGQTPLDFAAWIWKGSKGFNPKAS